METPLKKSRFTESQIVAVLKEGEAGLSVAELWQAWHQFGHLLQLEEQVRRR